MDKNEKESLYSLYKILTVKYNIIINDPTSFIKYIYVMDILHLRKIICPFVWYDYVFIDDDLIIDFIDKNKKNPLLTDDDSDHLSDVNIEIISEIVEDELVNVFVYKGYINHLECFSSKFISYYLESKENHFLFKPNYDSDLKIKLRNVSLNKLLN